VFLSPHVVEVFTMTAAGRPTSPKPPILLETDQDSPLTPNPCNLASISPTRLLHGQPA